MSAARCFYVRFACAYSIGIGRRVFVCPYKLKANRIRCSGACFAKEIEGTLCGRAGEK